MLSENIEYGLNLDIVFERIMQMTESLYPRIERLKNQYSLKLSLIQNFVTIKSYIITFWKKLFMRCSNPITSEQQSLII